MTTAAATDALVFSPDEWAEVDALAAPDEIPAIGEGSEGASCDEGWLAGVGRLLEDPAAKFERLTGRALTAPASLEAGDEQERLDAPLGGSLRPLVAQAGERTRWASRVAAAVAMAGLVYGGLLAASASTASDRERVADLNELAAFAVQPLGQTDRHFAEQLDAALDAVAEAQDAPLTLFPSYDPAGLDAAATRLVHLVREADPQTPVSQEGRLALGRIRIHQGRDAEAARVLGTLAREGGYRGPEARRLLDFIRAQGRR